MDNALNYIFTLCVGFLIAIGLSYMGMVNLPQKPEVRIKTVEQVKVYSIEELVALEARIISIEEVDGRLMNAVIETNEGTFTYPVLHSLDGFMPEFKERLLSQR